MRLTADERRRMFERQREARARGLRRVVEAKAEPRVSMGTVVAITVAGLAALAWTMAGTLSLSLPSTLLETFLPALW